MLALQPCYGAVDTRWGGSDMIFRRMLIGLATGLTITLCAAAGQAADGPAPAYAEKGAETCLKCHDTNEQVMAIQGTPHSVKGDPRTPMANHACESCHGASPEHIASHPAKGEKKAPVAIRFSGENISSVEERNAVCLTCHSNSNRVNWHGSAHASNDVACATCHTIHAKKDPVLVKLTQPEKCFTCHAQQRAQSFQLSHHPIREGKVACSDCHNVHGSPADAQLKEWTENETCYNCHAEKRGPFAFNHEPVRESCMNCHKPHGSNQASLLIERIPYLCQTCHDQQHQVYPQSGATLPGSTAYNPVAGKIGTGTAATGTATIALPGTNGAINMVGRGCSNCHTQVHGSNSPSGQNLLR